MPKRSPEELWKYLTDEAEEEAAFEAEMDRIEAMSPEEVDRELRAAGVDMARFDENTRLLNERIARERERLAQGAAPPIALARSAQEPGSPIAREPNVSSSAARPVSLVAGRAPAGARPSHASHGSAEPTRGAEAIPVDPDADGERRGWHRFRSARFAILLAASFAGLMAVVEIGTRHPHEAPIARPSPSVTPSAPSATAVGAAAEAADLRKLAVRWCELQLWTSCVDGLDRAAALDPAGDADPSVQRLREQAAYALAHPPPDPLHAKPPMSKPPVSKPPVKQ